MTHRKGIEPAEKAVLKLVKGGTATLPRSTPCIKHSKHALLPPLRAAPRNNPPATPPPQRHGPPFHQYTALQAPCKSYIATHNNFPIAHPPGRIVPPLPESTFADSLADAGSQHHALDAIRAMRPFRSRVPCIKAS